MQTAVTAYFESMHLMLLSLYDTVDRVIFACVNGREFWDFSLSLEFANFSFI